MKLYRCKESSLRCLGPQESLGGPGRPPLSANNFHRPSDHDRECKQHGRVGSQRTSEAMKTKTLSKEKGEMPTKLLWGRQ